MKIQHFTLHRIHVIYFFCIIENPSKQYTFHCTKVFPDWESRLRKFSRPRVPTEKVFLTEIPDRKKFSDQESQPRKFCRPGAPTGSSFQTGSVFTNTFSGCYFQTGCYFMLCCFGYVKCCVVVYHTQSWLLIVHAHNNTHGQSDQHKRVIRKTQPLGP